MRPLFSPRPGRQSSRPRSAFTLIESLVVIAIIGILLTLMVSAILHVRHSALRVECQNQMKQMATALHGYHDQYRRLPPALSTNTSDYWYLSWMGRILNFLEQDSVANELVPEYQRVYSPWGFFWLSSWGGKPPHPALSQVLPTFKCPAEFRPMLAKNLDLGNGNLTDVAFTSYLGVSGTDGSAMNGAIIVGAPLRLTDLTDGAGATLLIGERPPSMSYWFGWWYAGGGYDSRGTGDVVLGVHEGGYANALSCPNDKLGFQDGNVQENCDQVHFWSLHPRGGNFAFADGSVRFFTQADEALLQSLATRSGGEVVPAF